MKTKLAVILVLVSASMAVSAQKPVEILNPSIDMKGYLQIAAEAAEHHVFIRRKPLAGAQRRLPFPLEDRQVIKQFRADLLG